MKFSIALSLISVLIMQATNISAAETEIKTNPFEKEFATPNHVAPFNEITTSDYEPAIDRGIALAKEEINAITGNPETSTFENTIVALERTGKDLDRVLNVFYPLLSALSDNEMMEISLRVSPKLSDYSTSITLNEDLWQRVKHVYDNKEALNLTPEQSTLLQNTYDMFALNGALLEGADRDKYKELSSQLSELTTRFGQNVLKEVNAYEIFLTKDDLSGLPEGVVEEAANLAKEKGRDGEYLFTLAQPTYIAFLKYSDRPDLREKMYRLYTGRNIKGEYSNIEVLKQIAETRRLMANLLGYDNFASYKLKRTMAETPENVYELLESLTAAYVPAQRKEFEELTAFATELEGKPVTIQPWDYNYYSNKLREAKYSYNEEEMRPYFELSNVVDGVFGLATKLYGLTFEENKDYPVYHPDVKAYDVKTPQGEYLGVLYTDFFPRETKRPGAWMTEFKPQWHNSDGSDSRPHISIVMNFTKPTASKPSLLTPYEVETFLHEFGHALHGLMTQCNYASVSGTSVYRDFVELPSQFNENYMTQKEFLDGFAKHYQTGEAIPAELVDKLIASSQFGAAYQCLRQLNFGLLDMAWHSLTTPATDVDAAEFETKAGEAVAMFMPVEGSMMSPQFNHIFSGGYAAGYYSYKWAEVLDADAFSMFLKNGIFDKSTADSFRENILEKGGSEHPALLYRRFRGQDPTIDALLIRDGIKQEPKNGNVKFVD